MSLSRGSHSRIRGIWLGFTLFASLSLIWERREEARRSYTVPESSVLVASFVSFALLPGLLDVINSIAGAGPIATFDPVRDFALLPHLPLLVILFSYFQGAMLKARRWTTAAVLGCGLAMIFAVPGLCLGADWELARFGRLIPITLRDITILGTYFGLYVVAGAVVVVGAWRELKRLSPTGRPLRWKPQAGASAPVVAAG